MCSVTRPHGHSHAREAGQSQHWPLQALKADGGGPCCGASSTGVRQQGGESLGVAPPQLDDATVAAETPAAAAWGSHTGGPGEPPCSRGVLDDLDTSVTLPQGCSDAASSGPAGSTRDAGSANSEAEPTRRGVLNDLGGGAALPTALLGALLSWTKAAGGGVGPLAS